MNRAFFSIACAILLFADHAFGEPPRSISVQGYLETATGGTAVNGPVDFCVALFSDLDGTAQVWPVSGCHSLAAVPVENGLFALVFGDSNLTPQLWGNTSGPRPLFLRITAGGQPMAPLITLHTAPYAFRVGYVDNPELTNALEADSLKLGDTTPGVMGTLRAYNGQSPNRETISIIGHSAGTGGPGGGDVIAWNGRDPNTQTAVLDGNGNAGGGEFRLTTASGATTLLAFAQPDGASDGAEIQLRNATTNKVGVLARGRGPFGGTIGLFQESGGNAPFGAMGINLQAGADSVIELRHNNDENNMILHAKDATTGGAKLILSNGQLVNRQTITLEGNSGSGDGRIAMRDASNNETLSITTSGTYSRASIEMKDTSGIPRVDLGVGTGTNIPNSYLRLNSPNLGTGNDRRRVNIEAGSSANDGGSLQCSNANGMLTASLDGDNAQGGAMIRLYDGQQPANVETVRIEGHNLGGGEGRIIFKNSSGNLTSQMGTEGFGDHGMFELRDAFNQSTVSMNGANGNAQFDGCVSASSFNPPGCDVAESFELTNRDAIQPGMVLVMDAKHPGHLTLSSNSYDKKVAGIVSGAGSLSPGVKLGQRADGNYDLPIALSGRVYCFVDAAKNAVEIGDLLTTSETPGYAMKATDHERAFGAVLGKAMEPLEKGKKGLVLVLVALQ